MVTAAAGATGAGVKIAFLGDAAKLEGLADVLRNGALHLLHFLLGIEKAAGDGIGQKTFAELLEGGDFSVGQRNAGMLFFVESLALLHQRFVLATGLIVGHEGFNVLAQGADLRLVKDRLAEFAGFLGECGFFGVRMHNVFGD